ncbi:MAG: efflux RND transporter periplasmic adaptor subunit [Deltaproteobacteria bacterium]|nr:efflux RND transporter periplasmic adaptor subunit [Deltaproteobacteria bacterium]
MRPGKGAWNIHISGSTILALIFLTALAPVLFISCGKEEEKAPIKKLIRPIKIFTVQSGAEVFKRKLPGKVRAAKRVDLAFQVGGPLIELPIQEGQEVKSGALLARIDPKDYKVNLRNAEGQMAKANAALQLARTEYDRVLRIKKKDPGAVSQSMVDRRREGVNKAQADIASLQASVDDAKNKLKYTYLKAPFSGVIARRYVDNFQEVRRKQPVVTLDDLSSVEILVDVPENLMAVVRTGDADAVVEFPSSPGKQYMATLKEFATRADPATLTYQVVLTMPAPDDIRVLPGMTATVSGKGKAQESGAEKIIIPAIAVFADESGKSKVWIVDRGTMKVSARPVIAGELTGSASIRILDGLKPGDHVAVTGVAQLREGMQVRDLKELEGYKR